MPSFTMAGGRESVEVEFNVIGGEDFDAIHWIVLRHVLLVGTAMKWNFATGQLVGRFAFVLELLGHTRAEPKDISNSGIFEALDMLDGLEHLIFEHRDDRAEEEGSAVGWDSM